MNECGDCRAGGCENGIIYSWDANGSPVVEDCKHNCHIFGKDGYYDPPV